MDSSTKSNKNIKNYSDDHRQGLIDRGFDMLFDDLSNRVSRTKGRLRDITTSMLDISESIGDLLAVNDVLVAYYTNKTMVTTKRIKARKHVMLHTRISERKNHFRSVENIAIKNLVAQCYCSRCVFALEDFEIFYCSRSTLNYCSEKCQNADRMRRRMKIKLLQKRQAKGM